jgi:hypothetical protein
MLRGGVDCDGLQGIVQVGEVERRERDDFEAGKTPEGAIDPIDFLPILYCLRRTLPPTALAVCDDGSQ